MDARQRHALTHPLDRTDDPAAVAALRSVDPQPDGNLLVAVLAVDR